MFLKEGHVADFAEGPFLDPGVDPSKTDKLANQLTKPKKEVYHNNFNCNFFFQTHLYLKSKFNSQ